MIILILTLVFVTIALIIFSFASTLNKSQRSQKETAQGEWVSKREYDELKKQLEEKEEELKKLQGQGEIP